MGNQIKPSTGAQPSTGTISFFLEVLRIIAILAAIYVILMVIEKPRKQGVTRTINYEGAIIKLNEFGEVVNKSETENE